MGFADFFKNFKINKLRTTPSKEEQPSHWVKCPKCYALMYHKEVFGKYSVCLKCHYHFRMNATERIEFLCDVGSFEEFDKHLRPNDPLNFVDKESYKQRIKKYEKRTNRPSSVISGEAKINRMPLQIVVFDFSFMGGV